MTGRSPAGLSRVLAGSWPIPATRDPAPAGSLTRRADCPAVWGEWSTWRLPGRGGAPGHWLAVTQPDAASTGTARAVAAHTRLARRPRAIAHCRSPQDVQAAIRAARNCDLPLSVRGGGHDWAGRALCDGLVIDLSAMKRVEAYHENGTARIAGGARA